ncbi:DUF6273 domain-containing protein [Anaerosporobacter sp.]
MKEDKQATIKKKKSNDKVDNLNDEELLEQQYQNAIRVFNSMSCMPMTQSKLDMYNHLKEEFDSLGDYKDSKTYVKQCKEQYKKLKEAIIEKEYEDCCNRLELAKSDKAYQELSRRFKKLKDYKESAKLAKQCDLILTTNAKKNKNGVIGKGLIALAIVCLLILSSTRFGRYNISRVLNKFTFYSSSAELYRNLDSYKDSKNRYKESSYNEAVRLQKDGKLKDAQKIFYDVNTYQDSAKRLVEIEKIILSDAQIGDTVKVGSSSWIILDKQEDKVLCIKKKPISNIVYNNNDGDVSWDTSQIRNYLNSEFIKENFSAEEAAKIEPSEVITIDNTKFNTKGGNKTQDRLYLLSLEDVDKYGSVLEDTVTKSSWLHTSGGLQSAVSVYNGKEVNNYGNLATKEHVYAYPMFWYSLE